LQAIFSETNAPTVTGATGSGPDITYRDDLLGDLLSYPHPGGTGVNKLPSPMINAGVGLPKGFEVIGRYMPTLKIGNAGSVGLWGVGLKHDIGQWIPFVKRVPVLHFTLHYGYTNLNLNAKLTTIDPTDIADLVSLEVRDKTSITSWEGQNFDVLTQGHTANFIVGANLPVVALYGGVGISVTQTNFKMNGNFPIPMLNTDNPLDVHIEVTDESAKANPIDIEIKNQDGGVTKPRFNAGLRFKFAVVTLHADYTYANYSVATVGLGISFR
jgi:hypothetical protein